MCAAVVLEHGTASLRSALLTVVLDRTARNMTLHRHGGFSSVIMVTKSSFACILCAWSNCRHNLMDMS
jgi:hypothetical protein